MLRRSVQQGLLVKRTMGGWNTALLGKIHCVHAREQLAFLARHGTRHSAAAAGAGYAALPQDPEPARAPSRAEALSWAPTLPWWQEVACVLSAAVLCTVVYYFTAPAGFSPTYSAGIGILCAFLTLAVRNVLLERQYEARAKLFSELGDWDSRFPRVGQIQVHAKAHASEDLVHRLQGLLSQPTTTATQQSAQTGSAPLDVIAMHCYHGFGANLYSYSLVQANLARALGGIATSHDMPGFGLTERPSNVSQYFLTFNGELGSQLIDYELGRLIKQTTVSDHTPDTRAATATATATQPPQATKSHASSGVAKAGPGSSTEGVGGQVGVQDELEVVSGGPGGVGGVATEPPTRAPSPAFVLRASADFDASCDLSSLASGQLTPVASSDGDGATAAAGAAAGAELRVRKVLIGHSLGGICAALAALEDPAACAALVLVAPAILALPDRNTPLAQLQPFPLDAHGFVTTPQARDNKTQQATSAPRHVASHPIAVIEEEDESDLNLDSNSITGTQKSEISETRRSEKKGSKSAPARKAGATGGVHSKSADTASTVQWRPAVLPPGLVQRYVCPSDADAAAADAAAAAAAAAPRGAGGAVSRVVRAGLVLCQACALLVGLLVLTAFKPAIVAVLRVLVRSKNFWLRGLQSAYYDPGQVTDEVVDAYRVPQLVRGWESGLFMFLTARIAGTVDLRTLGSRVTGTLSSVEQEASEDAGLAKRLGELVRRHNTPILIIHGVYDKLVPASNSRRLAAMLPTCELVLMERCGHMPHEEWPRAFVELVREFVLRRGREGVEVSVESLLSAPPTPHNA